MSVHTDYKPKKPGLFDKQIFEARQLRFDATYAAVPSFKLAVMRSCYGSTKAMPEALEEHWDWATAAQEAEQQHYLGSCSEHGDFTNCYRGGFY